METKTYDRPDSMFITNLIKSSPRLTNGSIDKKDRIVKDMIWDIDSHTLKKV